MWSSKSVRSRLEAFGASAKVNPYKGGREIQVFKGGRQLGSFASWQAAGRALGLIAAQASA